MADTDTALPGVSDPTGAADNPASANKDTHIALAALTRFLAAQSQEALWAAWKTYADQMDVGIITYHHHAPDLVLGRPNVTVRTEGFPDGWVDKYSKTKLHRTDPILNVFSGRLRPMRWSEVDKLVPLSPGQMEYLTQLRKWLKGDGIGFPVFGPSGRNGYLGLGFTDGSLDDWDAMTINLAHSVGQSFHIRYCELILLEMPQDFTLNERELRILESMSQGTSDEIICGIVSAPLDSVQLSIRSILRKMGVSDRPSAILRGIGAGLVDRDVAISRAH